MDVERKTVTSDKNTGTEEEPNSEERIQERGLFEKGEQVDKEAVFDWLILFKRWPSDTVSQKKNKKSTCG